MDCPRCSKTRNPRNDSRFCSYCGAEFEPRKRHMARTGRPNPWWEQAADAIIASPVADQTPGEAVIKPVLSVAPSDDLVSGDEADAAKAAALAALASDVEDDAEARKDELAEAAPLVTKAVTKAVTNVVESAEADVSTDIEADFFGDDPLGDDPTAESETSPDQDDQPHEPEADPATLAYEQVPLVFEPPPSVVADETPAANDHEADHDHEADQEEDEDTTVSTDRYEAVPLTSDLESPVIIVRPSSAAAPSPEPAAVPEQGITDETAPEPVAVPEPAPVAKPAAVREPTPIPEPTPEPVPMPEPDYDEGWDSFGDDEDSSDESIPQSPTIRANLGLPALAKQGSGARTRLKLAFEARLGSEAGRSPVLPDRTEPRASSLTTETAIGKRAPVSQPAASPGAAPAPAPIAEPTTAEDAKAPVADESKWFDDD
ncbi:MAG: hypothetical protein ACI9OJ_002913 [Myxococcota bacterium]